MYPDIDLHIEFRSCTYICVPAVLPISLVPYAPTQISKPLVSATSFIITIIIIIHSTKNQGSRKHSTNMYI